LKNITDLNIAGTDYDFVNALELSI